MIKYILYYIILHLMNARTHVTNLDLVNDLMGTFDDDNDSLTIVKNKEYYIDSAHVLLNDISDDNYYEILQIILPRFNKLDTDKQLLLLNIMKIDTKPKEIIKYIKNPIDTKKKKKKMNINNDDY